jgi:hypothetical protein
MILNYSRNLMGNLELHDEDFYRCQHLSIVFGLAKYVLDVELNRTGCSTP